jgi:hypothetical protein
MASGSSGFKRFNRDVKMGRRKASQAGKRRSKAPTYTDRIPF